MRQAYRSCVVHCLENVSQPTPDHTQGLTASCLWSNLSANQTVYQFKLFSTISNRILITDGILFGVQIGVLRYLPESCKIDGRIRNPGIPCGISIVTVDSSRTPPSEVLLLLAAPLSSRSVTNNGCHGVSIGVSKPSWRSIEVLCS